MALEIERKFLVANDDWRASAGVGEMFTEGLLARMARGKVRIRRSAQIAWITVKGPKQGISRAEFEYAIPVADADQMLADLCNGPLIEKTRFRIPHDDVVWEVDEFAGALTGLVIAEVELRTDDQPFRLPAWVGREVTADANFSSAALIRRITLAAGPCLRDVSAGH
ncbi:CYTH domain-containing protein [Aquabacter sp. L1I39]|uniref:CYTH domain-containing protein n=1 Tax=Aquabacter sp. L1I39 TaxID=2820278 RepID=UPI001ADD3427|nr:CYTH domain-containing protein [Aquabacter sp. L1I39]QTL05422.1 CYTH domain-containing protein [Aquabacter sp. L1I39]